jgi:hypothetical protein
MSDSPNPHADIEALLTPQNSVLLLIDHRHSSSLICTVMSLR